MTVELSRRTRIAAPRKVALLLSLIVAAIGACVLAGWALDLAVLKSVLPFGVAMKANAAVGMLLCGAALAFLSQERVRKPARIGATVAAVAAITLGALTLSQDLAGLDLAIDQWLFRDADGPLKTAIAGRMSPPTSFSMMLMGIALAVAAQPIPARLRHPVLSALGSAVILVGGIALLGRVVETLFEFRFLSYARIASYTALAFVLLGCGLMALVRSEGGLGWSLDAATSSGFLIGVVAVIATAGVSYQFSSRLKDDAAQVSYTLEALKEIQKLSAFLGDFTISAGRYIITRDERTLDGREETKAAVQTSLGRLRKLTADRPGQQGHLDHIERLHSQRVAMSNEIIKNFRQQILSGKMPSVGEASPLGQQYPALGREIERLVKAMEADEYALLDRRQKQSDATWTKTFLLLPLGAFVSLTMLSLALFFLNSGAGERLRAQQALLKKSERLSVLHEIDLAIITARTPEQVAEAALPRLRDLLGLPRVIANLFDLEKNEAEWLAAVGRHRSHVGRGIRYSMELMGDVEGLKRGEVQLIDVSALTQRPEAEALLASGVRWYMVVPMIVGGELIGGLSFGGPSREFPSEQTEIAQEVAAQLAIAIAQSRLTERAQRADAQYRLVFENAPVSITMTAVEGNIVSVNPAFARIFGYQSTEEALADLGGRAQGVYADPEARKEYLRLLRRDGVVENFETQFRRADGTRLWGSMSGRSVQDLQGDESLLVTMITDITLRKEQEERIARLSRVKAMQSSINSAVVRIRERQPLLDELCRIAVEQGGLRAAWVGWHDANANLIRPIASAGHLDEILERIHFATDVPLDAAAGIAVSVLRGGVSRVSNDVRSAAGFRYRQEVLEHGILSAMHLPLTIGGTTEGVLILYATEAGFFDDEERRLLDELAADVSFALEFLQKSERLDYLAFYDPLTGLPNRSLFHNRLSHSLHSRGGDARLIAVILLDLERFRRVNETLGRKAGDDLLRDAGSRLHRANDTAARVGVDMYGLVLRGARTVGEVNRTLEAIVAACFAEPFMIGSVELRMACRAGVAIHPHDGADADALLRNAEAALRRSKGADDRIVFYAMEMNARVAEALAIENRLRGAIERREFVLYYQPKINLSSGRVTGLEALIRWQDPDTGLVPPGRFIPVLEETGLIGEVGRWAVEQAFVDLRAWAVQGIKVPRVAVNVSAIQLQRRDFVDSMIEEIRRGGDSPEWLELEVTESLVMRNVEDSTRKLSILRGMGVTVAIDDFGTGYSSLSYLGKLPVDSLKIDRSFVSGMTGDGDAAAIVSTIITLAHGLKLNVVAEGVETREQADMLGRLHCDEVQGYLYSRPVPAAEIATLLRGNGAKFSA